VDIFEYDTIYRKILIGNYMTSYKILQYPTICFWDISDAAY